MDSRLFTFPIQINIPVLESNSHFYYWNLFFSASYKFNSSPFFSFFFVQWVAFVSFYWLLFYYLFFFMRLTKGLNRNSSLYADRRYLLFMCTTFIFLGFVASPRKKKKKKKKKNEFWLFCSLWFFLDEVEWNFPRLVSESVLKDS